MCGCLRIFHGLLGAFADAYTALDTQGVVYNGIAVGILRDCADRTGFDERANVVVGTDRFIYLYHK